MILDPQVSQALLWIVVIFVGAFIVERIRNGDV